LEKIVVSQEVSDYFEELILILYKDEYFGFVESATAYVDRIIDFIFHSIGTYPRNIAPEKLQKFGSYYLIFKANDHTSWYIFFDFDEIENIYLISAILNNHSPSIRFMNL